MFDLSNNKLINYNQNLEVTNLDIYDLNKNRIEFKEKNIINYINLLKSKKIHNKIIKPFNKEDILIDYNFIPKDLFGIDDIKTLEDFEEEKNINIIKKLKNNKEPLSFINKLQLLFNEEIENL